VRARRARYDRASRLGQRAGYVCYLVAVIAFFVGFATSYSTAFVAVIVGGLAVGSILLLPSIIVGYAVKAAEREDREQGR
jgi:heme/copper-type cytochrome/quinol oxidase subunit 3